VLFGLSRNPLGLLLAFRELFGFACANLAKSLIKPIAENLHAKQDGAQKGEGKWKEVGKDMASAYAASQISRTSNQ